MKGSYVGGGLLMAVALAACTGTTGTTDAPRTAAPESRSTGSAPPAQVEAEAGSSVGAESFSAMTPATLHRAYPFTYVDLQRVPVSRIDSAALPVGAPPRIPWTRPAPDGVTYRVGGRLLPVPHDLHLIGRVGHRWVARGGCTRGPVRCKDRPRAGLHLLSANGRVRTIERESGHRHVFDVVVSPDGGEMAWAVHSGGRATIYRMRAGEIAPIPVPATTAHPGWPAPVAFVGVDDLLLKSTRPGGGRTLGFARTSGQRAAWDATELTAVTRSVLLGTPAFTPRGEVCRSRYLLARPEPRWTRCYRTGARPIDGFLGVSTSKDGRWLVTSADQDAVLIGLRDGKPVLRVRFDQRMQSIRFEDATHFLAVLDWVPHPESDSWPVDRIVRCDLRVRCERATPDIEMAGYEMLELGFADDQG